MPGQSTEHADCRFHYPLIYPENQWMKSARGYRKNSSDVILLVELADVYMHVNFSDEVLQQSRGNCQGAHLDAVGVAL